MLSTHVVNIEEHWGTDQLTPYFRSPTQLGWYYTHVHCHNIRGFQTHWTMVCHYSAYSIRTAISHCQVGICLSSRRFVPHVCSQVEPADRNDAPRSYVTYRRDEYPATPAAIIKSNTVSVEGVWTFYTTASNHAACTHSCRYNNWSKQRMVGNFGQSLCPSWKTTHNIWPTTN